MERLNWVLLGMMGVVTALGLSTSSGTGKTKTSEQPVSVSAWTDAPACSSCRIAQAEAAMKIAVTPILSEEHCPGNCQATGVCCDKSLPNSDTAVAAKTETHACEGECCLSKKATATASATATTDCPLTKAAEMIENLTKNYVCEGGECHTKPGQGTLVLLPIEESTKPEGLSNLLAAAEAVKSDAKTDSGTGEAVTGSVTAEAKPALNFTTGTLTLRGVPEIQAASGTLTINATGSAPGITIVTTQPETKPAVDNSRATARAAKLAKLEAKLEAPWELEFEGVAFQDIAKLVQDKYGVPVIIDRKALEEAAFDLATPISATKQPEIEAGDYLRGLLEEQGLSWIIPASNDRVLITTRTAEQNTLINRVYDVSELTSAMTDPETLVERIQSLIEPTTWRASGGMGDLGLVQNEDKVRLIALNGYWVQRQVAVMLADLRLGNDNAAGPRKVEKETGAIMRRHQLPGVGLTDDLETKRKLLIAQKRLLLNLLKQQPCFDVGVFEIVDFNNEPVLLTKQLPAVHRQIAELIHSLNPNKSSVGGFSASCDYGDFDPSSPGFFEK